MYVSLVLTSNLSGPSCAIAATFCMTSSLFLTWTPAPARTDSSTEVCNDIHRGWWVCCRLHLHPLTRWLLMLSIAAHRMQSCKLARVSPGPLRRRARVCAHVRIPPSHMKKPPNTHQTPAKIEKRRSAGRAWEHGRTGGVCGPRVHGQTVPEGPPEASGAQMPPHSREQQGPEAGSELLRPDCGGGSVSAENFQGIYEVGETCGFA